MSDFQIEDFSDQTLRSHAGSNIYNRGTAYYYQDRVTLSWHEEGAAHLHVMGRNQYCVDIQANGHEVFYDCTCPYAESGFFCKHMVAGALFLREYLRKNGGNAWKDKFQRAFSQAASTVRNVAGKPYYLFFSLQESFYGWVLRPYTLEQSVLPEVLQQSLDDSDPTLIHELIERNPWLSQRAKQPKKKLSSRANLNANKAAIEVANLLISNSVMPDYYYFSYKRPVTEYFPLLAESGGVLFLGEEGHPLQMSVDVIRDPVTVALEMNKVDDKLTLKTLLKVEGENFDLSERNGIRQISDDPIWLLWQQRLLQITDEIDPSVAGVFLERPVTRISAEGEAEFFENYLLDLAAHMPIEGPEVVWDEVRDVPVKRLYLSDAGGELLVRLYFGYGAYEVPYEKTAPAMSIVRKPEEEWTLVRIHRDLNVEEEVWGSISSPSSGLKRSNVEYDSNVFLLRARVEPVDFLMRKIPHLTNMGFEIYGEKDLKSIRVNRNRPTVSLSVSTGIDWFDVEAVVKFGNIDVSLKEVRRAIRRKDQYVKLADGTVGEIPNEWLKKYKHLFRMGEQTDQGVRMSQFHLTLLDELLEEADQSRTDAEFHERLRKIMRFEEIKAQQLPEGFTGTLRPYQKAGYEWLHFLDEFRFGGCLADDMGLGKTVQVLVFLQSKRERVNGTGTQPTNLVVVPRSLLVNWQREAEKFTPDLRVLLHFGTAREKSIELFNNYDIVLTTYGTMRRDVQLLRAYDFSYIVLDESQAIKNPMSQVSKASRLLRSKNRLAMSGTPVENSTFELWAQFAFLNPGLLGSLEYFKSEFANPIQRNQDNEAANFLRKMVYPFILRRTKEQVAPELPPRNEEVVYADMESAQRKAYEKTRNYYRKVVLGMVEEQGMNNARMKILEGLLRLRQISNHPKLVTPGFRGKSAKFELLVETLETLHAEGHKALIFSQFVQMLKILEDELNKKKIPYSYLDGRTRKRQERVDEFQNNPDIPFFLISLKAGGVGLNLTAADYVIHIDPWWNPAVEMQATDRTHRIGQEKPVFVYKLITRGTVEEKILELQNQKRKLVEQLITTESSFFKDLSPDDVKVLFS